jgi:hypothetical protein
MPYEPFRKNYRRAQQPPLPGSEREYIDQELRKIQDAFQEVVSQTTAIQTIYPDPPSGGGGGGGPHTHPISDVVGLQTALDGKQAVGSYAATSHSHIIADTTGLQAALDGKQAAGSYAAASHGHVIADVTGLQTALDGKQASGSYAAASHSHIIADTTGLQTALDGKAATSHSHIIADVTGLQTALDGKQAAGSYSTTGHTHVAADITDFNAAVDARVGTPAFTNKYEWNTTTATAGLWIGTVGAGSGTYSTQLPTTTSVYTSIKRARWANVITTTNQVLGQRNTEAMFFRGNAAGQGGFLMRGRFGFDVWTNGGRMFAGMATATTVVSADPSALNNTVGFCVDAADNGLIHFLTRSTSATKQSTGLTITSGKGYYFSIQCLPNSSAYTYSITDLNTGTVYSNTATLTLPTNTTMLTANVLASNAALTPVTSIQLGISKIEIIV